MECINWDMKGVNIGLKRKEYYRIGNKHKIPINLQYGVQK